uniref:Uncharacterized protein n=1 Tax=Alexandrium andersonii TaxID=327968 RepID=A0A7S2JCN4_9DINO|mmetsp:Transcript_98140/g.219893  ORF Transcript_98140/g.219893 Transcript_98140/m.219893 type:complete len:252 (+) Transcript_98140:38-793(+)
MDGIGNIQPEPNDDRAVMLTSFVASGDMRGVRRVIEADPGAVNEVGLDGTSPLCAAAMWGHIDIVRTLIEAMASPGLRNENGPRWTALHAATLQEEGKVCMLLLDHKASPHERDVEGVTPCDYASVSEGVWPLFAARGCERVAKAALVEKGVLRKASTALELELQGEPGSADGAAAAGQGRRGVVPEYSRPGSAYVVSREYPPRPGSALPRSLGTARPASSRKNTKPIDILEEEDEGQVAAASAGLRSLGI